MALLHPTNWNNINGMNYKLQTGVRSFFPQVSKIPAAARTAILIKGVLCERGLLEVKCINAVKRLQIGTMKTL
jgi:hypothetical protein